MASLGILQVWENQPRSQSGPVLGERPAQSGLTALRDLENRLPSPKIFWVAGFSVLGAVALGQGLSRWLSRPVQRLTQTCETLAAARDGFDPASCLLGTSPFLELAQLEQVLNGTLTRFQRQRADLEAQLQSSQNLCRHTLQCQELILRTSPEGRITFANLAVCNLWGRSLEAMVGGNWRDCLSAQDAAALFDRLGTLSQASPSFLVERFHSVGVRQALWIQWLGQGLFDAKGELQEIQWVGRDISPLKESQHLIERITENTPTLLYIYDQVENRNVYVNRSVTDLLGYSPQQVQELGNNLLPTICHPEDFPRIQASQSELRTLAIGAEVRIDYRARDAQGKWRWLSSRDQVFSCTEEGRVHYTLGTAQDITDRKEAELRLQQAQLRLEEANSKLRQLVNTDSLTGVANRRCFDLRLEQEWQRLQRERQPLSLMVLDVDYFKKYNDYYGHLQGDQCLIQIAQALSAQATRSSDLVARVGGEEFAILLPNTPLNGAKTIAQRLQDYLANLNLPHLASPLYRRVSLSLGLTSVIPSAASSPGVLISQADQALYRAKELGRNRAVVFESARI